LDFFTEANEGNEESLQATWVTIGWELKLHGSSLS